jgi:phage tail-like protein
VIEDPIPSFRFLVVLGPLDTHLPAAQALQASLLSPPGLPSEFQEITGLGAELETLPVPEGGLGSYVHNLPVRHKWNRIVMKRGVVRDIGLYAWYSAGYTNALGARRDGLITLLTPQGVPAIVWAFTGGMAVKWSGPDFKAQDNAVCVECIEIAHNGILQVPVTPPGVG